MTIGASNASGNAGMIASSASSAPADPPITMTSGSIMSNPLVDPSLGQELAEPGRLVGEPQVLLEPEAQKALAAQRPAQHAERAVLELALEVDQHVAARDELHLGERAVGRQAVIGEHDRLAQPAIERRAAVGRGVV